MKKKYTFLLTLFLSTLVFAQNFVQEKDLVKKLEKNKDSTAVFVSSLDLSNMTVSENGEISLSIFAKSKIKLLSGMDMTNINERLRYKQQPSYEVSFAAKDIKNKTYEIINISDIETIKEYKARIEREVKEAEEKKKEQERIRLEKEKYENLRRLPVQVINQEVINITGPEAVWLPSQIQDKLKSNLQEYLGLKTVVDSKSEAILKKLQAESESEARDETSSIELGKITTAKYALFTKIRKTGNGYTISVDFTDLTTGEQMASVTSKEYSESEYLYGSTGAIDEITLGLGAKLNLEISSLNKNLLANGLVNLTIDDQLALARQNEENFNKLMRDYDAELSKLMTSNDINAVQNKNRIEAEKALLIEKKNAEKKRQEELRAQKDRAVEDEKLEAERSIALKIKRDKMAEDAAEKAAEVRKLKAEKQGVFGQINVIESKKKVLVEIRQSVEERALELYDQLIRDKDSEEKRIRNKAYSTVELGSDGNPTEQAMERREKQVIKSNEKLTNKFFEACEAAKQSTENLQKDLLSEIRADQKALKVKRTVSSLGDELKVNFGKFEGSQNGWNVYISLYSDGLLLFTDSLIVNYEALSGKKAPDMATELDDDVIEEYTNNVDMYNSLLMRGDPIIYLEIDYNVTAEPDDKPSQYKFNFSKVRVINTVSGKVTQTSVIKKVQPQTMKPEWDLREFAGIVEKEKATVAPAAYKTELYMAKGMDLKTAKKAASKDSKVEKMFNSFGIKMVEMPNKNFKMLNTEVTQQLFVSIMGVNPSRIKGDKNPVENISVYDAISFCNKLSEKYGFTPVYSVKGKTNPDEWNYVPYQEKSLENITYNFNANGFRLPTIEEWEYAAKGGKDNLYSGSDNLDEVGWYYKNSEEKTHPVAQKNANEYGLYDMNGNVEELCWDYSDNYKSIGGSYASYDTNCKLTNSIYDVYGVNPRYRNSNIGFRIVSHGSIKSQMVKIPGKNLCMLKTEMTQGLYKRIMQYNPSHFIGTNKPVERVSWNDAVYFCNKLSEACGLMPVYSVNGTTDVTKWDYRIHEGNPIKGEIIQNTAADGFRLPTEIEWKYAAKGGENYKYSGSYNFEEVGWFKANSGDKTKAVAQKKPNGYGLYDMSGNVCEWCWDSSPDDSNIHYVRGGGYADDEWTLSGWSSADATKRYWSWGFRIVCSEIIPSGEIEFIPEKNKFIEKKVENISEIMKNQMVEMPGKNFSVLKTEVTQELYESLMGENPSHFIGSNRPVERVSWNDAVYFCNKLSEACGLTPVYSVNGTTDVTKWNYIPHEGKSITGQVMWNFNTYGFRLPTEEEWKYAAEGGEDYKYSGSNNFEEVGWFKANSGDETKTVAQKKPNGYGLYDMSGNVYEWCWDSIQNNSNVHYVRGGGYANDERKLSDWSSDTATKRYWSWGFRVVCFTPN